MMSGKLTVTAFCLLSLCLCLGFTGCGSSTNAPSDAPSDAEAEGAMPAAADLQDIITESMPDATPEAGDALMLHLPAEMPHLNPLTSTDYYSSKVLEWVFDKLLDRHPDTLANLPSAAESWDISEDHLVYTFHLRQDVVFSDGVPMTAADVKFSFDAMMDPKVDAPQLRSYFINVVSCEVVDDYTVRFTCDKPYFQHLVIIGDMYIMPRHIYGQGDFNNHPNNRAPIGSGMYKLDSWETGQRLVLTRNPHYWGTKVNGRPYVDKVVYNIITDDNTAFQVLSRGDLDFLGMPAELFMRRANTPKFKEKFNRFAYFRPAYNYIGWNMRKPMFSDSKTRLALAMLLDRESIRQEIFYGQALIISGSFMPDSPENNSALTPVPFDPAQAQNLLKEAGWTFSDKDGLLTREGTPFRFEVGTTNQNPVAEKILTLYKEELGRIGIDLVIRPMEWASLLDRVDKREFDAVLMGWSMPPDPDPYQVWHSSQVDAGSNYVGFVNAEADQLIEQARTEFDRDARIRLYHRFQEIVHEEQPYLFLLAPKVLAAGDKRIQGIRLYPIGVDQREWFVPTALQRYTN